MRVIPLAELLWRSCRAMARPHQAFLRIKDDERLSYPWMVLMMLAWGAMYAFLHFRTVDQRWLWSYDHAGQLARFTTFVLGSLGVWLLGSCGVFWLARLCRRPVSVQWAEVAALYLWIVWALMPLIDLVHLVGVPTRSVSVFGTPSAPLAHASWVVAFPLILAEMVCLMAVFLTGRRGRWLIASISAIASLMMARFILEPLPELTMRILGQQGYSIDLWTATVWLVIVFLIWLIGWRLSVTRWLPWWVSVAGMLVASWSVVLWGIHRRFTWWG